MTDPTAQAAANIGVVGLAVMGSNLARNLASREGNTVAVYNRTHAKTEELVAAQPNEAKAGQNGQPQGWKPAWVMIGESALLSDPYFLDTSKPDPEGDCPVYTAMIGQDRWQPTLVASSFAQFLRIVSTAMEIAAGFGDAIMDDEDEDSDADADDATEKKGTLLS